MYGLVSRQHKTHCFHGNLDAVHLYDGSPYGQRDVRVPLLRDELAYSEFQALQEHAVGRQLQDGLEGREQLAQLQTNVDDRVLGRGGGE